MISTVAIAIAMIIAMTATIMKVIRSADVAYPLAVAVGVGDTTGAVTTVAAVSADEKP